MNLRKFKPNMKLCETEQMAIKLVDRKDEDKQIWVKNNAVIPRNEMMISSSANKK
jgi:hypothetical protein